MEKQNTQRHSELADPKLPIIHGESVGNRMQQHVCPSPIGQQATGTKL